MPLCPPAPLRAPDATPLLAEDTLPGNLRYAQLRLEITRLARRVVGPEQAEELVQRVFRHAVRTGPRTPRDHRGVPRPAYLAALVHSFAGGGTHLAAGEMPESAPEIVESGGARGG
jgi:hypothetical protein